MKARAPRGNNYQQFEKLPQGVLKDTALPRGGCQDQGSQHPRPNGPRSLSIPESQDPASSKHFVSCTPAPSQSGPDTICLPEAERDLYRVYR